MLNIKEYKKSKKETIEYLQERLKDIEEILDESFYHLNDFFSRNHLMYMELSQIEEITNTDKKEYYIDVLKEIKKKYNNPKEKQKTEMLGETEDIDKIIFGIEQMSNIYESLEFVDNCKFDTYYVE